MKASSPLQAVAPRPRTADTCGATETPVQQQEPERDGSQFDHRPDVLPWSSLGGCRKSAATPGGPAWRGPASCENPRRGKAPPPQHHLATRKHTERNRLTSIGDFGEPPWNEIYWSGLESLNGWNVLLKLFLNDAVPVTRANKVEKCIILIKWGIKNILFCQMFGSFFFFYQLLFCFTWRCDPFRLWRHSHKRRSEMDMNGFILEIKYRKNGFSLKNWREKSGQPS